MTQRAFRRIAPRRALVAGLAAAIVACAGPAPDPAPAPTKEPQAAQPSEPAEATSPGAPRLIEGLGSHHHPITTSVPEVQRWFDQGLVLTFGFNHEEAVKSFREGARLDPDCAMCHWGEALALGPNINAPMGPAANAAAVAAVARAQALRDRVTAAERDYIDALATRYSLDPAAARADLDRAYADAMRGLRAAHPADVDAAVLTAEALMDLNPWNHWSSRGEPVAETPEIVSLLEWAMEQQPDHPGANHYYIHAIEASPDPSRAEPAADRLVDVAPAAGHLVHMPSHIYFRVGRYDDALEINRRAAAADERYFAWCGSQGIYRSAYYPHNVHFLWAAANVEGRSALAIQSSRKLAAKVSDEIIAGFPPGEEFRAIPIVTLARFGRWDAVLGEPAPDEDLRYVTGMWHYARSLAYLRTGQGEASLRESELLDGVRDEAALDGLAFPGGTAKNLLGIAALHLAAERSAAAGRVATAVAKLEEAVLEQDGLPYTEPPPFYFPVRQALGAVLLDAGRAADAEAVYRADLRKNPKNGWSLFGLSEALRAQGETGLADGARSGFDHAFARADVSLEASRF